MRPLGAKALQGKMMNDAFRECSNLRKGNKIKQTLLNRVNKLKFQISEKDKYKFYQSREWATIKTWASMKYEKVCFCCKSEKDIQLDHISPISTHPKLALQFQNVQYLCRECNKFKSNKGTFKFKRIYKKRNGEHCQVISDPTVEEVRAIQAKYVHFFPVLKLKSKFASIDQLVYLKKRRVKMQVIPTKREARQLIMKIKENNAVPKVILRKRSKEAALK
jgi:5-methylcytosine-specific restriction endonuclease McrA